MTQPAKEQALVEALREVRAVAAGSAAVDLGSGDGRLTLALADTATTVVAVDWDEDRLSQVRKLASAAGHQNVTTVLASLAQFDLPPRSVDVVFSNYSLHALQDADKRTLVRRCHRWLRPGGQLVVVDMMFGRGQDPVDRRLAKTTARSALPQGPRSWWRLLKDLLLFSLRLGSKHPVPAAFWVRALGDAGFRDVTQRNVSAGTGLVAGVRPG